MAVLRSWWCPLVLVTLLAGCHNDPKDPQHWVNEVNSAKRPQDKVRVFDDLRKSEALNASFLPMLHEQLANQKSPEARGAVARILGFLKSPTSVEPLVQSVDTSGGGSATDRMNREIAGALGQMGDPRAVPPLLRLLNARDPFLELQAAESLGQLKAKSAVPQLLSVAQDEGKEALVANRAIEALGQIGDASVVPDLVQLMFEQRGPISLYDSSSSALYRLGKPAGDALLAVLAGKDEKLQSWSNRHHIAPAALYSKAAQVLGYLLDSRAEPLLVSRLAFKAENDTQQGFVRLTSAEALGRLHAVTAIHPLLAASPGENEVLVRSAYVRALGRIGSKDALLGLPALASKGPWEQRAPALDAIALLGGGAEVATLESLLKEEAGHVTEECAASDDAELCKNPGALTEKRAAVYRERIAELKIGETCGAKVDCWAQALGDANPGIRSRAALMLGHSGQTTQLSTLLSHANDQDREARLAVLLAADWLTQTPEGVSAAHASIPALEKQIAADSGKSDWVETSDNAKRLIAKLSRAD